MDEAERFFYNFQRHFTKQNFENYSVADWERIFLRETSGYLCAHNLAIPLPYILYRGRINPTSDNPDVNFTHVKEMWAPPKKLCLQGRCNMKHNNILYCSTDLTTVIYEMKPDINSELTIIEYGGVSKLLPLNMIGVHEMTKKNKKLFQKDEKKYYSDMPITAEYLDHIISLFFKFDQKSSLYSVYNITNAFTNIYLKKHEYFYLSQTDKPSYYTDKKNSIRNVGIIYPSATIYNGGGTNLALIPSLVEKMIKPIQCYKYKILDKNEETQSYKVIPTYITSKIYPNGMMKWEKLFGERESFVGYAF